jgi:hypothetical protein
MLEQVKQLYFSLVQSEQDAYFHGVQFQGQDALNYVEALVSVLSRQHSEWVSRNFNEVAIDSLENRLLGYTRR